MIDSLDRTILYELDLNSSQSVADLSKKLGLSRDKVLYRMKRLQGEGILKGFTAAIDTQKLGLFVYKTYLRLEKNEKRQDELLSYLLAHPLMSYVAETDGRWDLNFAIYAKNPSDFHKVQSEVLLEFSDIIKNFSVYTIVEAYRFSKSYLVGVGTGFIYFGGELVQCDELDYQILHKLSQDSRITKVELADNLGVSSMAIKYRVDRLEKEGVIVGYPVSLDLEKLGLLHFKLQLHFGTYDKHSEQQLLEFCKTNPNFIWFIRQIGDCMIELEVEVEDFKHLNDLVSSLRRHFSKFLREVDTIFIRKEQYKWVPLISSQKVKAASNQ